MFTLAILLLKIKKVGFASPFFFLHSHETRCAGIVARAKGHVVPDEVPRNLLRRVLAHSGKERFRFYILGGLLSLARLLLMCVVDVTRRHVELL